MEEHAREIVDGVYANLQEFLTLVKPQYHLRLHSRGQGFESPRLHFKNVPVAGKKQRSKTAGVQEPSRPFGTSNPLAELFSEVFETSLF